ncbi:LOW QUALITY PROTEIN: acyl-CoA synthetase family member 2, mitochondrial-like [Acanthaster planci]|uniref:Medium-chain acyl-CoA ligase ACSF2, mitochondrial n=1 Tax=Acanthaster planci TaxID=133434 RepID=A0A8B7YGK4_ACAPL|nr:LOW QUALITY PROTEIN: acyl-CoA synthetase family member 2, mitochondrial-like [Acanthaster planci]
MAFNSGGRITRSVSSNIRLSYFHNVGFTSLIGKTIGQVMDETTEKFPDRDAHVFLRDGIRRTFEDFREETEKIALGLLAVGIKKGDRVGIWEPSTLEWVLTQFATSRIGAIMVSVNPVYRVHELEYALKMSECKAVVCDKTFRTLDYYAMLREVCPELENDKPGQLKSAKLPALRSVIFRGEDNLPGTFNFNDLYHMGGSTEEEQRDDYGKRTQFDEPINIMFTSGTTGFPKGATLTHHNVINNAFNVGHTMGYHEEHHRICVPVPLFHTFGTVCSSLCGLVHGATCVFPSPGFDAKAALQAVSEERCTSLYGTPTMFIDYLNHPRLPECNFSSLSTGILGGSPCPVETVKQCMTRLNMKNITLKIIDVQSGEIVPRNMSGELCSRGYTTMIGYWNNKEKTDEVIDAVRWFHTGDIAVMNDEGYVSIVGRSKDVIIRGGENIYPVEIENFLYIHPKINDVQVIGVPDECLGEIVCAWVKLKEGQTATEGEIKQFCKGEIAHFKIPKMIHFVSQFPLTISGKVQKFKMRDEMKRIM